MTGFVDPPVRVGTGFYVLTLAAPPANADELIVLLTPHVITGTATAIIAAIVTGATIQVLTSDVGGGAQSDRPFYIVVHTAPLV